MRRPTLKTYWVVWCAVLATLLAAKLLAVRIGWRLGDWLGFGYILGVWFPIMLLNHFEQEPIRRRIEEVRSTQTATPPLRTWWLQVRVLFGDETFGDPEISRLRSRYRGFAMLALASFLLFPVFMAVLSL